MPKDSLVYDPYFAALGGGELYTCLLAQELTRDGGVSFLATVTDLRAELNRRFGLNLAESGWITLRAAAQQAEVTKLSRDFDRFICVTLANPPVNQARTGILIVQFPWGQRPPDRVLASYHQVICYSHYCRNWIKKRWGVDAAILPPAYPNFPLGESNKRRNLVVSIGRFQAGLNSKGYSVLVPFFSHLRRDKMRGWEYYVIGGTGQSQRDRTYLADIEQLAIESGVKILPDLSRPALQSYLASAKLLWHGAGLEDPDAPERAEHFGISIVEAMRAGVVPLVYAAGGPTEVVEHACTGFHWHHLQELAEFSNRLAEQDSLRESIADAARKAAGRYAPDRLRSQFRVLLGRIEDGK